MSDDITPHHGDTSPFSEKARVVLRIDGPDGRSVIRPTIMPNPYHRAQA